MHLKRLFDDCFTLLGEDALYIQGGKEPFLVRVLIRHPDRSYALGEAQIIENMCSFEMRTEDMSFPNVGDRLMIKGVFYKIYNTPLREESGYVWRCEAIGEERDYV